MKTIAEMISAGYIATLSITCYSTHYYGYYKLARPGKRNLKGDLSYRCTKAHVDKFKDYSKFDQYKVGETTERFWTRSELFEAMKKKLSLKSFSECRVAMISDYLTTHDIEIVLLIGDHELVKKANRLYDNRMSGSVRAQKMRYKRWHKIVAEICS